MHSCAVSLRPFWDTTVMSCSDKHYILVVCVAEWFTSIVSPVLLCMNTV